MRISLTRRLAFLLTACLAVTATARANPAPFDLNMDRVKSTTFGGSFGKSQTFIIPSVTLNISAYGNIWSQAKGMGGLNAQAHAKIYVKGLDRALLRELATLVQNDLITKMRAAGYTVLTYDDVKSSPDIASHSRDSIDAKYGLPTMKQGANTFVVVSPTEEQAFDRPLNGPVWWMRGVAKEKNAMLLFPEITFVVPLAYGENDIGYKRAATSIVINPGLRLGGAMIWGMDGKGGSASIQVLEHGKRLAAETAGVAKKLSEDKTEFSREWQRTSGDYLFELDQAVFRDGILRVCYAINSMTVAQVQKAHK